MTSNYETTQISSAVSTFEKSRESNTPQLFTTFSKENFITSHGSNYSSTKNQLNKSFDELPFGQRMQKIISSQRPHSTDVSMIEEKPIKIDKYG